MKCCFFSVVTLPGTAIDPSTVRNYQIFSITSNSFEMSWHVSSTLNHTFQVQVFRGKDIVQNLETEEMKMDVFGLEAGVMYSVWISYETCGNTIIFHQNVKTGNQPLKKKNIFSPSLPPHLFLPPLTCSSSDPFGYPWMPFPTLFSALFLFYPSIYTIWTIRQQSSGLSWSSGAGVRLLQISG